MRNLKFILFRAVIISFIISTSIFTIFCQVSSNLNPTYGYTFLNTTGTYTPLSGATVFQSGTAINTDGVSSAITLPFTFTFNGIKENTIYISNNGFITFATAPSTAGYTPLSTTTTSGYDGAISGTGMNCVASTAAGAVPEISYGSSGGDFVVQFQDIGQSGFAAIRMTYQIVLKSDGKTIQIVYGPNNAGVASAGQCQVGIRGTNDEDWNNRTLSSGGNWNTAGGAAGTSNSSGMSLTSSTTLPASGRIFQWSPTSYLPTYNTSPTTFQEFTSWVNGSGPSNVPSTNWATNGYGNASWQIDNNPGTTATTGWGSATSYTYSPVDYAGASGGHSARFHSGNSNSPQVGYLDYYVDLSSITGTPTLDFYHINTSGTDILQVFLSTDGGTTFTQIGSNIGTSASWTAKSISLGSTNSATSIIRFKATADFGTTDIGIDHLVVTPPPTPPTITSYSPTTDFCINGGQIITISGTNFLGSTSVTFNSVNATSFTVVNSTTITAVTPSSLTAGAIVITNPAGSASSSPYTVIANPTVAVSPSSATFCSGGSPIALTASGASTYTWSPSTGLSASSGANVNANPTTTTTYVVTGTDGNGCSNTASTVISVNPVPTISTVTATPSSICTGGNSQLLAVAASSPKTYSFSASSGSFVPLTGATVITGGNADSYFSGALPIGFTFNYNGSTSSNFYFSSNGFISLTNTIGIATTNALATATSPVLAPLWDDLDGAGPPGTASYLTTGSAPNRILTVEWLNWEWNYQTTTAVISFQVKLYEVDGHVEFIYNQNATAVNLGSASIGISGAVGNYLSLNNSSASPSASSTTETTNISTKPASGQVYSFMPPTVTYAWTPTTFLNSGSIANPLASGVTSTTTYMVTASTNGCTSAPASVTVTTGSILAASATASPSNVCYGSSTTLGAVPTGGGEPYTYLWSDPSGATSQTVSVSPTSNATYTVTVTDACLATTTASVAITVDAPSVGSPTATPVCGSGISTLSTTGNIGTIKWYDAATNGNLVGTGTSIMSPNIIGATTYYVSASNIGSIANGARTAPTSTSSTTPSSYGLVFDVTSSFLLNSVKVYPSNTGNITIALQNSSGTTLQSQTFTVSTGSTTTPVTLEFTGGWSINTGTGYRLLATAGTLSPVRESTLGGFPYALPGVGSITSGYISGVSSTYYYFYDWSYNTICETSRTAVVVPYTVPPTVGTASATPPTICAGSASSLNLTGFDPSYTSFTWSNGAGSGTSLSVSPSSTTTYTVTATDGTCSTSTSVTVTVNPTPTGVTATSNAPLCQGADLNLMGSATLPSGVSTYAFTASTGTYTPVTSPTTVHASAWDDAISNVTIPFTFNFNNVGYTSVSVNSNGYITFGSTTSSTTGYTPISATTTYSGAVSAFGRDLISNASTVVSGIEGSAPNRVLVIQWNNAARYNVGIVSGDVLNFQIRLAESTNEIQIVYGTCTATSTTSLTAQVGLRGASNTDYNNRTSTTSWSSTSNGSSNSATMTSLNTIMPSSGQTYTFAPVVPFTFSWSGPNSFTSSLQNPTLAGITTAGAGIYTVTVTNQSSLCSATSSTTVEVGGTIVTSTADAGPGTLRAALACVSDGGTITYDQPTTTTTVLTAPLAIDKNVTIMGASASARPEITTSTSGISIDAAKTLTLQDVDIKSTAPTQTLLGPGAVNISGMTVSKE